MKNAKTVGEMAFNPARWLSTGFEPVPPTIACLTLETAKFWFLSDFFGAVDELRQQHRTMFEVPRKPKPAVKPASKLVRLEFPRDATAEEIAAYLKKLIEENVRRRPSKRKHPA